MDLPALDTLPAEVLTMIIHYMLLMFWHENTASGAVRIEMLLHSLFNYVPAIGALAPTRACKILFETGVREAMRATTVLVDQRSTLRPLTEELALQLGGCGPEFTVFENDKHETRALYIIKTFRSHISMLRTIHVRIDSQCKMPKVVNYLAIPPYRHPNEEIRASFDEIVNAVRGWALGEAVVSCSPVWDGAGEVLRVVV
ncbi:hypothetical protein LTR37_001548 [Vermiconidia calcicola]|uniref:Uncharacterized protein n=1 Tax=Vermiconidia calcicola TaxID=1690605 RepID=A0ACC3NV13_9PEZI|nr:hypothetical protein LTR37_001548 [Vermiconidia calcicola]